MIVVQGSVRIRAEDSERLRATAVWLVPAARNEPGCRMYSLAHDMLDPTLIHIAQCWESEEAFAAHTRTPHATRLGEFMRKITLQELLVKSYVGEGENIIMGG
ncbi:MAG: antibiotic biosynthesis monooxygenase [Hyphomonadaceae bacterium]|nr:antibiotic biosynthesis monooxygenase [Hyphomonadaceae bacterium]